MLPETADMTVFLAVVRHGSFSRAANSLLVSQPAVSERIGRLERTLGTRIFDRGARGTTLTAAGQRLVPFAERTIGLLDEAARTVRAVDRPAALRVGVHTTFAHRAVPLILGAVGDPAPKIKVRDAHSDEIIALLLDGVIDVGFVLPAARPPALRFAPLPADPIIAVSSPSDDLAQLRRVPLRLLRGRSIAVNRWGSGAEHYIDELTAAGVADEQLTECSDGLTAIRLARQHHHIALVTRSLANEEIASSRLAPVALHPTPRWSVPLALAYRAVDQQQPTIAALRKAVRHSHPIRRPAIL